MGEVYEAVHTKRKRVALKTLRQALARNGEARARFLSEGETPSRVRHPHVVDITDVGEADGVPFLVMELLEGESLSALVHRVGALSVETAVDILLPVIDAVAIAHEHGIVHRASCIVHRASRPQARQHLPRAVPEGASLRPLAE